MDGETALSIDSSFSALETFTTDELFCGASRAPQKTQHFKFKVPSIPARRPTISKLSVIGEDPRRQYRRNVAIPRYLDKKKRRKWDHELMHPSRSSAAHKRQRNGGQFSVGQDQFTPATVQSTRR